LLFFLALVYLFFDLPFQCLVFDTFFYPINHRSVLLSTWAVEMYESRPCFDSITPGFAIRMRVVQAAYATRRRRCFSCKGKDDYENIVDLFDCFVCLCR
jgi:hypothetical protein